MSKNYSSGRNVGWDFDDNNVLREALMLYMGNLQDKSTLTDTELKFRYVGRSLEEYTNSILPSERTWTKITNDSENLVEFYYYTSTNFEKETIKIKRGIYLRTHKNHGYKELEKVIQSSIDCGRN
jgi:hypothetical protein